MSPDARTDAFALTRRADFLHLSTLDGTGHPDSRILFNLRRMRAPAFASGAAALADGFSTWIATNTSSRKVAELRHDPRVALHYADTASFEGLTLQGTMEEVLDPSIRSGIWIESWAMYYPGGLEGGDFSIFRFRPARGRYYRGLGVAEFDAAADLP